MYIFVWDPALNSRYLCCSYKCSDTRSSTARQVTGRPVDGISFPVLVPTRVRDQ